VRAPPQEGRSLRPCRPAPPPAPAPAPRTGAPEPSDPLPTRAPRSTCCLGVGYGCRDTKVRLLKTTPDDSETAETEDYFEAHQECGNACWGSCCERSGRCNQVLPFKWRDNKSGKPDFVYQSISFQACCKQFPGGEITADERVVVRGAIGETACIDCCCFGLCWGRRMFYNPCGSVWATIVGTQPLTTTTRRDEQCPCVPIGYGYDIYALEENMFQSSCFKPPAISSHHVAYFQHMGRWNKCMAPCSACFYIPTSEATFGRFRVHQLTSELRDIKYQPQRHTKIDFAEGTTPEQRVAALESALSVLPWSDVVGCCPNPAVQMMLG